MERSCARVFLFDGFYHQLQQQRGECTYLIVVPRMLWSALSPARCWLHLHMLIYILLRSHDSSLFFLFRKMCFLIFQLCFLCLVVIPGLSLPITQCTMYYAIHNVYDRGHSMHCIPSQSLVISCIPRGVTSKKVLMYIFRKRKALV